MNYTLLVKKIVLVLIAGFTALGGIVAPQAIHKSSLLGYSAPYITTTGSDFDTPVTFGSTVSFQATTTYRDNVPACFGDYCNMSITYVTSGTPDVGFIAVPTSSNITVFGSREFSRYDYFNTSVAAPAPLLAFFPASTTRNRWGTISQGSSHFTISGSDGDDLDGTARNSAGDGIFLSTGDGGTLGGSNAGGDLRIYLGSGAGGGINGYIWATNGSNADMRFKNSGTGVFRVGDSSSEDALTLDHDGDFAIVSSTPSGPIYLAPNVFLGGTTTTVLSSLFLSQVSILDDSISNTGNSAGLLLDLSYNPTTANNTILGAEIVGQIHADSVQDVAQLTGIQFISWNNGFGDVAVQEGAKMQLIHNGEGLLTAGYAVRASLLYTGGGTSNEGNGVYVDTPNIAGSSTVTEINGINIQPITGGTTNNAFLYDNGSNSFVVDGATGHLGVNTTTNLTAKATFFGTATSTVTIDSSSVSRGSCLKLKDMDGSGFTYCSVNGGTMTCSVGSCE